MSLSFPSEVFGLAVSDPGPRYTKSRSTIIPQSFLSELVKLPVAAKWKELGIQLGVRVHKLEEIQANNYGHPNFSQQCLTALFICWLNNNGATFSVLAKALHTLQVIDDVRNMICPAYAPMSFKKEVKFSFASKWKDIGHGLGVPADVLKPISQKRRGYHHGTKFDPDQWCFLKILKWWMENSPTVVSLQQFIKVLHVIGAHDEEKEMKEIHYGKSVIDMPVPPKPELIPECVVRYSKYLREKYLEQPVLSDSDWPPSLGGQFIRLALIPRQRGVYANKYESVIKEQRDYVRGNVDKILAGRNHEKMETHAEQVLELLHCVAGKVIPLRVLIDGAPGVGKTTLSRKFSQDWASGVLLQEYSLVVLLRLRDRTVSQATSIDDFFYHDDPDLHQSVVRHVRKTSGKRVLLIFDGFDELSTSERSCDSFFMNIIEGKILSKCSVVVTSRPYASVGLQELAAINRHIEVLGFTEEMIKQCIMKTIKDNPQKAEELCTQLHERMDIMSLCYIPLNCAIMLYVYQQENFILPKTLTELYNVFALHAIKRHARNLLGDTAARRIRTLDKLPKKIEPHFSVLCKIAFDSLIKDQLVFHEEDIEEAFPDIGDQDIEKQTLALMTVAKSYSKRGREVTCNFLHLTIQEFLAAKWAVANLSQTEVSDLFKQNLDNDRLRMMLLFLAGLAKHNFPVDEVFAQGDQLAIATCPPNYLFLLLCHFIYESESTRASRRLAQSIKKYDLDLSHKKLSGFEFLVVLTFLSQSGCKWNALSMRCKEQHLKMYREVCYHNVSFKQVKIEFDGIDPAELRNFLDEVSKMFSNIEVNVGKDFDGFESITTLLSLTGIPNISIVSFLSVVYSQTRTPDPHFKPKRTLWLSSAKLNGPQFSVALGFFLQSGYKWHILSLRCKENMSSLAIPSTNFSDSDTSVQLIEIRYECKEFAQLKVILKKICGPLNAEVKIKLDEQMEKLKLCRVAKQMFSSVAIVRRSRRFSIEFLSVVYRAYDKTNDSHQRIEIELQDIHDAPSQPTPQFINDVLAGCIWDVLKLKCNEKSLDLVDQAFRSQRDLVRPCIKEMDLEYDSSNCIVLLNFLQRVPQIQSIGVKITAPHSEPVLQYLPKIASVKNVSKFSSFSISSHCKHLNIPTCRRNICRCQCIIDDMCTNTNLRELHVTFHQKSFGSLKQLLARNTALRFLELFMCAPLGLLGMGTMVAMEHQVEQFTKDLEMPLANNNTFTCLKITWSVGSILFERDPITSKLVKTQETVLRTPPQQAMQQPRRKVPSTQETAV